MIDKTVIAGIVAVFLASPLSAAGVVYDCDIANPQRARGWISPKIAIILPDEKSAMVMDAITLSQGKDPVPASIQRNNGKRLIVTWLVHGIRSNRGRSFAGVIYRASVSKSTGAIDMSMIPRGYDKGVKASGTCKTRRK